ncbi:MAG TPA: copper chaperone PCu(A)C [Rhizomicrobium sp.]|jgi:hypothetical protein|nr:copper chaperone PCu(A)C [Rhizomicrobium sp.]
MRKVSALALSVAVLLAAPASAAEVVVTHAWFRALPGTLPGAGYFDLRNTGKAGAVLTGASSPACGMLMLHKSEETGGTSMMAMVDKISVASGSTVKFAPGGYHLMCMNPTPALKPGTNVAVTFQFADGTKTTADFAVKNATGQ